MYRPLRKRSKKNGAETPSTGEADTGVKGPNSALTAFLKEQGINANTIRDKWLKSQKEKENEEESTPDQPDEIVISKDGTQEKGPIITEKSQEPVDLGSSEDDLSVESTPVLVSNRRLRSKRGLDTSDTETNDKNVKEDDNSNELARSNRRRRIQQESDSDEEEFVPSVSRKELNSLLTETSGSPAPKAAKTQQQKRVRKKKAADLLDRRRSDKIRSLQELSIMKISEQITKQHGPDDIQSKSANQSYSRLRDVLGGISTQNFQQLSKTLCKNRALNDDTLQLFLQTNLHELQFGDCSKLSFHGYQTLAIFTPNLKHLSLQMCGQLNNESLLYLADRLKDLESLFLDGPFLINEQTWIEFFTKMKTRLKHFKVSNTHRFTAPCLTSLLQNCGSTLETLGLSRVDTITNFREIPLYVNSNLSNLALEHPFNEDDVTDDMVIELVSKVGNLKELVLNGCSALTDSFIINGLCEYWDSPTNITLQTLELEELDQLENNGLPLLFEKIQFVNLQHLSLKRSIDLNDKTLLALLKNNLTESLLTLNLNSLNNITSECFDKQNLKFKKLQRLNTSFSKAINDTVLKNIISEVPTLRIMEVFGCSRVDDKFNVPANLVLVGRASDTL